MAIGNAIERNSDVIVFDEKGSVLWTKSTGKNSNQNNGLKGYTSSSVNIQRDSYIYTYDDKGREIAANHI